ncbi:MAG: ThiF family adenylyltransferase [Smithellaceae bacterium]|jgi:hypothetical protein
MKTLNTGLSRISKLFIDRDETAMEDALIRRQHYAVTLRCGRDVEKSKTLQVALITAANIASKCFPGAVRVVLEETSKETPLLIWPSLKLTFSQALACLLGPQVQVDAKSHKNGDHDIVFGDAQPIEGSLRVTFDGWVGKVGPTDSVERLPEREYCSLSGVVAAALAISELFLSFAEISVEASRRAVGLSLWRPELDVMHPEAIGVPLEFLPRDMWVLGLGHLGNAYLWSLSMLPYRDPKAVEIFLNDFDKIEPENVETGLIFNSQDVGRYKTRVCSDWLEKRKFRARLVERRFDADFRCQDDEPRLALCGFDSNSPRRDLANSRFLRVIESGLGGTVNNFDTISLHTLPNVRKPEEIWPDPNKEEMDKGIQALARKNPYLGLAAEECGRFDLAGKSVAVPFVGAVAASFVLAEIIRLLHRGPAYTNIKLILADLDRRFAQTTRNYDPNDFVGLTYCSL